MVGATTPGSSNAPTAISTGPPVSKVSGVPQSEQNPRRALLELAKLLGLPRVHSRSWAVTRAPKNPPNAFWHMRQWQIEERPNRDARNRTAPHWHPPEWKAVLIAQSPRSCRLWNP